MTSQPGYQTIAIHILGQYLTKERQPYYEIWSVNRISQEK